MNLQIVTHQMHPVKAWPTVTGCGRAGIPMIVFNEFKTRAEPSRSDY